MNFSIDFPCSPAVGQYKSSENSYSEVTSYEFYDYFSTHSFMFFDKKNLHQSSRSAHNPQCLGTMLISINVTL